MFIGHFGEILTVSKGPILVTGGAGFIGSNFARHAILSGYRVITLDALTYAGNLANLEEIKAHPNHKFIEGSITDGRLIRELMDIHQPAAILNFAAESHVDRSIDGPGDFIKSNVFGVYTLLEAARNFLNRSDVSKRSSFRFLQISTDEVYGSIKSGFAKETKLREPSSPYAASKASADNLVQAWHRTYQLPILITNCSNNYGPFQFPEKLIPLMIIKAIRGEVLPIYGDGRHKREWLHVEDYCAALEIVLAKGSIGETYNIGSGEIRTNLEVVNEICSVLDQISPRTNNTTYKDLISFTEDRPGHDARYALDSTRAQSELGWASKISFPAGLKRTVKWYLENLSWVYDSRPHYKGGRLGDPRNLR